MGATDSKSESVEFSEIFPAPAGLFLAARPPRLAEHSLHRLQVGAILDITCAHTITEHHSAAASSWTNQMKYMNLPVFDTEASDLKRYFVPAIAFISDARAAGLTVLVHCEQGISRSSCVVMAYMVAALKLPLIEAYRDVVRARPIALPNTSFLLQLMQFEQDLKQDDPDAQECLLSVVLLEREIVPGLKDLGVTHSQITKAIREHPGDWVIAVRIAMNEAAGNIQAPSTLKLQKDGTWKVEAPTAAERARARHARKKSSKASQELPKEQIQALASPDSPISPRWEPSKEFLPPILETGASDSNDAKTSPHATATATT